MLPPSGFGRLAAAVFAIAVQSCSLTRRYSMPRSPLMRLQGAIGFRQSLDASASRIPRNEQFAQLAVQDGFRLARSFGSPPMIPLWLAVGAHRLTRFQVE